MAGCTPRCSTGACGTLWHGRTGGRPLSYAGRATLRRGATSVLRALGRAERAPATIAAY
ncbi:MAG: hypothetical protein ACJ72W_04215 [Actinoallomurus sp.]